MHLAYHVCTLVDNLPLTITAFAVGGHASLLYVGTSTGALLVYELNHAIKSPTVVSPRDDGTDTRSLNLEPTLEHTSIVSANLRNTQKTFSKKSIDQLLVVKELNAVISISDSHVLLHDMETLTQQAQLPETKGCTCMAVWTEAVTPVGADDMPYLLTQLAVCIRRKLLLYSWKDGTYADMQEYNLSGTPRAIAFLTSESVALSMQKETAMLFLPTGDVESQHSWTGSTNSLYSTAAGLVKSGKTRLAKYGDGYIVTQDAAALTIAGEGARRFDFPAVVDDCVFHSPYLIAVSASRPLEVRHWVSHNVVQSFELQHSKLLTFSGTDVFVASSHVIWMLSAVSMENQTLELVKAKNFDEAVALVDSLNWDAGDKLLRRQQIKKLGAYSLFERGNYEQAMVLFQELAVAPEEVLALFPITKVSASHLPDLSQYGIEINLQKSDPEALRALTRFLTERRALLGRLRSTTRSPTASPRSSISMAPPGTAGQRGMHRSSTASSVSTFARDFASKVDLNLDPDEIQAQSVAVDTALLRIYLRTTDSLVGSLVRVKNNCDPEVAEELLLNAKKYNELIDFYYGKGMHRRALEKLARFGSDANHPLHGHQALLAYLQKTVGVDVSLTLEFATWLTQTNPAMGLELFKDDAKTSRHFPTDKTIAQLRSVSLESLADYLEFLIYDLDNDTTAVHEEFIATLVQLIQLARRAYTSDTESSEDEDEDDDDDTGDEEESDDDDEREAESSLKGSKHEVNRMQRADDLGHKLSLVLRTSQSYDAARVLALLPAQGFDRDRAVVLGRLQRHAEVIDIYVSKLNDVDKAESYCVELKGVAASVVETCFTQVVKLAMAISTPLDKVTELITRRARYLNALEVVSLLSDDMCLGDLLPFFEETHCAQTSKQRNAAVVKNLAKREHMIAQADNGATKQRAVVLNEMSVCPVCAKRIGNSFLPMLSTSAILSIALCAIVAVVAISYFCDIGKRFRRLFSSGRSSSAVSGSMSSPAKNKSYAPEMSSECRRPSNNNTATTPLPDLASFATSTDSTSSSTSSVSSTTQPPLTLHTAVQIPSLPSPVLTSPIMNLSSYMLGSPSERTSSVASYSTQDDAASQVYLETAVVMVVVAEYEVSNTDELPVKRGDYVRLHAYYSDGWALASDAAGNEGFLPAACMVSVEKFNQVMSGPRSQAAAAAVPPPAPALRSGAELSPLSAVSNAAQNSASTYTRYCNNEQRPVSLYLESQILDVMEAVTTSANASYTIATTPVA
ncbi:Vacuolar morphogenesis protein 6 [Sorochytrium milnesiophthora]